MAHRFFINRDTFSGILDGEDGHHAARVLRLRVGEFVTVCDGYGQEAEAKVLSVASDCVDLNVGEWKQSPNEPRVKATIYLGIAKGERMDYAIQKCVELGATTIVPFTSERCIVKIDDGAKKVARWQKIAKAAASQAGRGIVPIVQDVMTFEKAIDAAAVTIWENKLLFCYEGGGISLKERLNKGFAHVYGDKLCVDIMTGPEGGYTPEEAAYAATAGITAVTLGKRILRCETAPVAALAAVMYHYGEM